MPNVDFKNVDEEQQHTVIPEGTYPAVISKIDVKETSKGDEMWSVQFKILEGDYKDKIVFSFLVFNDGGYGNIKKLYKEIGGFDLGKKHNCQPVDIEGEKVLIDVKIGSYTNKSGVEVKNNTIPYGGFSSISSGDDEWA